MIGQKLTFDAFCDACGRKFKQGSEQKYASAESLRADLISLEWIILNDLTFCPDCHTATLIDDKKRIYIDIEILITNESQKIRPFK